MYYSGGNECQLGVGFVVNKSIAGNVVNFKGQSDSIAKDNHQNKPMVPAKVHPSLRAHQ